MRTYFLFLSLLLLCIFPTESRASLGYSRQMELSPIKINYSDFFSLLNSITSQLSFINAGFKDNLSFTELTIGDSENEVRFSDEVDSDKMLGAVPSDAYELTYRFFQRNANVAEVQLHLSDNTREIKVSGIDPKQVDALFILIKEKLNQKSVIFGGSLSKILLSGLISGFGGLLLLFGIQLIGSKKKYSYLLVFLGIVLICSSFLSPFSRIFPGFYIYSGEPSFIRKYSAEFSFLALVITVLTPCIGLIRKGMIKKSKARV